MSVECLIPPPGDDAASAAALAQVEHDAVASHARDIANLRDAFATVQAALDLALRYATRLQGKIGRITEAARPIVDDLWMHGDDCPHRHCPDCPDGDGTEDDCESPGFACDCHVADIHALREAVFGTDGP